jgi:hypothetical protein
MTRTGCLVTEESFARATGLARVAQGANPEQLVFTDRDGSTRSGQAFAVTGGRERELVRHAHVVVEITGDIEGTSASLQTAPPASGVALPPQRSVPSDGREVASRSPSADGRTPSGAAGVTPRGNPAHEPGDAVEALAGADGEVPPNAASPASTPDQIIAIGDLPRLNVRTFRVVGGACAQSLVAGSPVTAASRESTVQEGVTPPGSAPTPATRRATFEQVTLSGCVIREASVDTGAGGTPPSGRLLLTRATRSEPRSVTTTGGAVPGSPPSGAGTGTDTPRAQPAGPAEARGTEALTFALEGHQQELTALVDQRVSLEGMLRIDTTAPQKPSAHSTAPSGTLVVESFRRISGDCR